MRTRKEIEAEIEDYSKIDRIAIELLMDIRDALVPESKPAPVTTEKVKKPGRPKKNK